MSTSTTRSKKPNTQECRICGDRAIFSYFGVISCSACKVFFKRYAENQKKTLKCDFDGQCEINLLTRHVCTACRLKKCFDCGMQVERLRSSLASRRSKVENNSSLLPTTNLLRADVSSLTDVQWVLLNNVVHCYSPDQSFRLIDRLSRDEASLDVSLVGRVDQVLIQELLSSFYQEAGKACRNIINFRTLLPSDQSILLHTAADNVTCLAGIYTFAQTSMAQHQTLFQYLDTIYSPLTMKYHRWATSFALHDDVLFKLALALFSLSTVSRIFQANLKDEYLDVKTILDIENCYAELMWKYLLYRYTFKEAVQRYLLVTRWFLAMSVFMHYAHLAQTHVTDIITLIEDTEIKLILEDVEA